MAKGGKKFSSDDSCAKQCWFLGLLFLGMGLLVLCITGALSVKDIYAHQNSQNALMNTTCLLLNYTVFGKDCYFHDDPERRFTISCFEEAFQFRYLIANQTLITSALTLTSTEQHQQSKVGADSFYRHKTRSFSPFSFRLATITVVTTIREKSPLFI